jgi:hypothetical protein
MRQLVAVYAGMIIVLSGCGGNTSDAQQAADNAEAIGTATPTSARASNEHFMSRADYGKGWPLTVESGTLRCDNDAVTFETDSLTYGVNGTALTKGLPRIDPIWAPNPEVKGLKIDIGPLIDEGLALCE